VASLLLEYAGVDTEERPSAISFRLSLDRDDDRIILLRLRQTRLTTTLALPNSKSDDIVVMTATDSDDDEEEVNLQVLDPSGKLRSESLQDR